MVQMADSSLTVTPNAGAQSPSTQNGLQANGATNLNNGLSGKIQTSVSGDQLRNDQGIQLTPTPLPTINLGTATPNQIVVPVKHHFNSVLMVFSILLFVTAIVLFRLTSQSGKNHN